MRIKIIGENNCARATRHLLRQAGFAVTEFLSAEVITQAPHSGYAITIDLAPAPHTPDLTPKPDHSTHGQPAPVIGEASPAHGGAFPPTVLREADGIAALDEASATGLIHFDSVDSALEAAILRHVTQLAVTPVVVDRPGGVVHSERELRIVIPRSGNAKEDEAAAVAVEFGVLRGFLDLTSPPAPAVSEDKSKQDTTGGRKKWWMFGIVLLAGSLLALTGSLQASPRRVVEGRGADGAFLHLEAALAPAQGQFGTGQINLALIGGEVVSSSLYDSGNTALKVNCVVGCSATSGFSDNSAFSVGSSAINVMGAYYTSGSAPTLSSGNAGRLRMDASSYLYVDCVTGCSGSSGGGTSSVDEAAFSEGTTAFTPSGGYYKTSPTALTNGQGGSVLLTANRAFHVTPYGSGGTELFTSGNAAYVQFPAGQLVNQGAANATPWNVQWNSQSVSLTGSWPYSGALGTVSLTGSLPAFASTPTVTVGNSSIPVTGTFWQATQPVSWSGQSIGLTGSWPYSGALGTVSLTGTLPAFASTPAVTLSGSWPYSGALGTVSLTGSLPAFASTPSVKLTDGANTVVVDPCKGQTKLFISISLTANTQLISGTSAKKIYICSFHIVTASAENIALVEGTGTVCATGTAGVGGFGGSTAATGWNFAANGGIAMGNGDSAIGAEASNADNLCLFVSGSGQKSGGFSYVVQ